MSTNQAAHYGHGRNQTAGLEGVENQALGVYNPSSPRYIPSVLHLWAPEDAFLREEFNENSQRTDVAIKGVANYAAANRKALEPMGRNLYDLLLLRYFEAEGQHGRDHDRHHPGHGPQMIPGHRLDQLLQRDRHRRHQRQTHGPSKYERNSSARRKILHQANLPSGEAGTVHCHHFPHRPSPRLRQSGKNLWIRRHVLLGMGNPWTRRPRGSLCLGVCGVTEPS